MKALLLINVVFEPEAGTGEGKSCWLKAEVSLPALPRVGDQMFLSSNGAETPFENKVVTAIKWRPMKGKRNVFEPIILMKETRQTVSTDSAKATWEEIKISAQKETHDIRLEDPLYEELEWLFFNGF